MVRQKNSSSVCLNCLCVPSQWDFHCGVLLTGTPVQNNLQELFSLLAFIDRCTFKPRHVDTFVEKYSHAHGNGNNLSKCSGRSLILVFLLIFILIRYYMWSKHTCIIRLILHYPRLLLLRCSDVITFKVFSVRVNQKEN